MQCESFDVSRRQNVCATSLSQTCFQVCVGADMPSVSEECRYDNVFIYSCKRKRCYKYYGYPATTAQERDNFRAYMNLYFCSARDYSRELAKYYKYMYLSGSTSICCGTNVGAIIGCVIGAVAIASIIGVLCWMFFAKKGCFAKTTTKTTTITHIQKNVPAAFNYTQNASALQYPQQQPQPNQQMGYPNGQQPAYYPNQQVQQPQNPPQPQYQMPQYGQNNPQQAFYYGM